MTDKRAHDRHQSLVYYRVTRAEHTGDFGHVVDMSERGLLLMRGAALAERSSWDLILHCGESIFGKSTVHFAGQVRWCRPAVTPDQFDCGIQIKAIARRDQEVLGHLMRHKAFDSAD